VGVRKEVVSVDRLKSYASASSSTAIWDAVVDGGFCSVHRLNMEVDLQSLFGLHVT
jgi:hypothetical protein